MTKSPSGLIVMNVPKSKEEIAKLAEGAAVLEDRQVVGDNDMGGCRGVTEFAPGHGWPLLDMAVHGDAAANPGAKDQRHDRAVPATRAKDRL